MENDTLLPCPFCGVRPQLCETPGTGNKYVSHPTNDCVLTRGLWRYGNPVEKWNSRKTEISNIQGGRIDGYG